MAGMEWLRNIRRREFYYDFLLTFRRIRRVFQTSEGVLAKVLLAIDDCRNDYLRKRVWLEEELEEGACSRWLLDQRRLWNLYKKSAGPLYHRSTRRVPSLPILLQARQAFCLSPSRLELAEPSLPSPESMSIAELGILLPHQRQ